MAELIQSGRIVDIILALMVIEAAVVCGFVFASRRQLPVVGLLLNLGAGAALLLALRAVATGADWRAAGIWLSVALLAHAGDLVLRLRR